MKNNISIGDNITVGIGAVVVKNLTDEGVYTGVPAKIMRGECV